LELELPVFVTLTMEEIREVSSSQRALHIFITSLRKDLGEKFRYISVIEFQKRGAVHFHTLLWDFPITLVQNERHTRYIQKLWGQGFVDFKQTDGSPKIAGYMGKYMAKAMHDKRLCSKRAYNASRNVYRPYSLKGSLFASYSQELIGLELSTLEPVHEKKFGTQWMGECHYKVYDLT